MRAFAPELVDDVADAPAAAASTPKLMEHLATGKHVSSEAGSDEEPSTLVALSDAGGGRKVDSLTGRAPEAAHAGGDETDVGDGDFEEPEL